MAEPATATLLQKCGLPQAWCQQAAWRILETRWDRGLRFLNTWHAWKSDPLRPRMLHYVSLMTAPIPAGDLLASAAPYPELKELADEVASQWFGLLPGFHRLTLSGGQVLLTVCVGEVTTLLRQHQFLADSVYLDPAPANPAGVPSWDIWTVKALARCCRRGTALASTTGGPELCMALTQCGFEVQSGPTDAPINSASAPLSGQFNPRWTIKHARHPSTRAGVPATSCAVIGAGLAGASVAAALALRGWQVQVLDQGEAPAAGASGLPVGLVVPHVSADDCALSRLSRSGVRLMLQQARHRLCRGQDWDDTGTLERRLDGSPGLPTNWPELGRDWSREAALDTGAAAWLRALHRDTTNQTPAIWHARGAWLKPAHLVQSWLSQPGVTFQGKAQVSTIRQNGDEWELLDAQGQVLTRASRVVFANASAALPLLEKLQPALPLTDLLVKQLPAMQGVRGLLSWAMHPGAPVAAFPPFPVNGAGSVIPVVPMNGEAAWFVGSSYQPDSRPPSPDEKNHAANLERLKKLVPGLGHALASQFAPGLIRAWKNTRCVTSDRLPVVGPLHKADHPSLWICAGMGSRGLSFSVLCAELLAAQWGGEPLPIEAGLARSLDALRGGHAGADHP